MKICREYLLAFFLLGFGQSLIGQSNSSAVSGSSSAPAAATLPPVLPASLIGNDPGDGHLIFSLGLGWNESTRQFTLSVPNKTSSALTVLGVQATSGIYVVDFPSTIPVGSSASFVFVLVTEPSGEPSSDFIKILTSNGVMLIESRRNRAQVAQFSTSTLKWAIGSAPSPMSTTLTMGTGTSVPLGVTALGIGNTATLSSTGPQSYTITVTPGSTASAQVFPVIVTFNPKVAGANGIVSCQVK